MTRAKARQILDDYEVKNKFKLRTVSFCDLARKRLQVLTILDWGPGVVPSGQIGLLKEVFWTSEVIVEFA